jgi:hypothetical protein
MANEELHQLQVSIDIHIKGQVITVFMQEKRRFEKTRKILFVQE